MISISPAVVPLVGQQVQVEGAVRKPLASSLVKASARRRFSSTSRSAVLTVSSSSSGSPGPGDVGDQVIIEVDHGPADQTSSISMQSHTWYQS